MIDGEALARAAWFEDVGMPLGGDLRDALGAALGSGAVHSAGTEPLAVFRAGLAESVGRIARGNRAQLFLRFLRDGPYDRPGRFLRKYCGSCLRDEDTIRVLRFISGHIVNCFQGFVAEVLAAGALARWLADARGRGRVPANAQLYLGDYVRAWRRKTSRGAKAADAHVLSVQRDPCRAVVYAVAEVKSNARQRRAGMEQLVAHLTRARRGLFVGGEEVAGRRVRIARGAALVLVTPALWTLPRTFRYEPTPTGHQLLTDEGEPPHAKDEMVGDGARGVQVVLRWSHEALAAAAYEMSHWFMGRVGEAVWAESAPPWLDMSPSDAGRNAAKQMLYYALLRVRSRRDWSRGVALYNAYCFGYALGMNFRDRRGVRQMMWPSDLEEIAARGETAAGCRIW